MQCTQHAFTRASERTEQPLCFILIVISGRVDQYYGVVAMINIASPALVSWRLTGVELVHPTSSELKLKATMIRDEMAAYGHVRSLGSSIGAKESC